MNPSDWQRIRSLFDQAIELPEAERQTFIDQQTRDATHLREELQTLLQAHDSEGSIKESIDHLTQEASNSFDTRFLGLQLGPFQVKELVGKGGMGLVYRAERNDGRFEQEVAIKFLRSNEPLLMRHIQKERQTLSSLSHPNIAKIIDAGTSEGGTPYLIMEYVRGIALGDYLDQRELSQRQKLGLFQSICHAIDHSHRHLIIHRDIKPSNIMVDEDGLPKLIDFGIAKQLVLSADAEATMTRDQVWSPNYASPEQVRGEALSTATDIYALGLVLYRLVAGQDAQPVQHLSLDQAIARICDQPPPDPSKSDDVSKDLARVIQKAIHKDPKQRYASAKELADDVNRFIRGQPVMAVGDSLTYRISKWINRHRLATATMAVTTVLLLLAARQIIVDRNNALASESRALAAEADSQVQLSRANEVSSFLTDIFNAANLRKNGGEDISAQQLLDQAFADIQERPDLDPLLRIDLLKTISEAYVNSGSELKGLVPLELAREIWNSLDTKDPLLEASIKVGIGDIYLRVEQPEKALPLIQEAVVVQQDGLPDNDPLLAQTYNDLGSIMASLNELDEGRSYLTLSLSIMNERRESSLLNIAATHHNLARLERRAADYNQALQHINESLDIKRSVYGEDEIPYADSLHVRSQILRELGNWDQVRADLNHTLGIYQTQLIQSDARINRVLGELANHYHDIGDFDRAESYYQRQLSHAMMEAPRARVITINNLASLYEDREEYERALPLFEEAIQIRKELYGETSASYSNGANNLGRLYRRIGRLNDSRPLLQQAYDIRAGRFDPDHPRILGARLELAWLTLAEAKYPECAEELSQIEQLMTQSSTNSMSNWRKLRELQGDYWLSQGDQEKALHYWQMAYERLVNSVGENHPFSSRLQRKITTLREQA